MADPGKCHLRKEKVQKANLCPWVQIRIDSHRIVVAKQGLRETRTQEVGRREGRHEKETWKNQRKAGM